MESRTTTFPGVKFSVPTLIKAVEQMTTAAALENPQQHFHRSSEHDGEWLDVGGNLEFHSMTVHFGDTERTFADRALFFAELRSARFDTAKFGLSMPDYVMSSSRSAMAVELRLLDSRVHVTHNQRSGIDEVFGVFEDSPEAVEAAGRIAKKTTVFIGHGGQSAEWKDVRDYLRDQARLTTFEFGSAPRASRTVVEVLQEMLDESSFAVIVLSGEDELKDGSIRARQNVIHEAGYFQGKLGPKRVVMLLEEGVDTFSNIDGVQYISYEKGRVRESFGELIATINREFPLILS